MRRIPRLFAGGDFGGAHRWPRSERRRKLFAMARVFAVALLALLATGCAGRGARPVRAVPAQGPEQAQGGDGKWREMTWPEYYNDLREKAWRRGAAIVWINPPDVRKVQKR
jgi:hypothetical protein